MVEPSQFRILDKLFDQTQKRVDRFLTDLFLDSVSDQDLMKAIRYASLDGGKRIRPLLVYASAIAVGAQLENADAPASAVELIHSYSLVHDDLPAMDDDDLRRGKPSVHIAFNEATAILVGDALQSLAFQSLSEANSNLPAQTKLTMIETLSKAAGTEGMTGGQAMDLDAENRSITLDALEDIHRLKTGALIQASVRLAALCNPDTTANQFKNLNEFANKTNKKIFSIPSHDAIGLNKNIGSLAVNNLSAPGLLISSSSFSDSEIIKELNNMDVKLEISPVSQFQLSGGSIHCLTNEL